MPPGTPLARQGGSRSVVTAPAGSAPAQPWHGARLGRCPAGKPCATPLSPPPPAPPRQLSPRGARLSLLPPPPSLQHCSGHEKLIFLTQIVQLLNLELPRQLVLLHGDTDGVVPRPERDLLAEGVPGLPLAPGLQRGQLPRRGEAALQGDLQDTDGAGVALLPRTRRTKLRGSRRCPAGGSPRADPPFLGSPLAHPAGPQRRRPPAPPAPRGLLRETRLEGPPRAPGRRGRTGSEGPSGAPRSPRPPGTARPGWSPGAPRREGVPRAPRPPGPPGPPCPAGARDPPAGRARGPRPVQHLHRSHQERRGSRGTPGTRGADGSPRPPRARRSPRAPRTRWQGRSARSCGAPGGQGGHGSPGPPGQPQAGWGTGRAGPPGPAGRQGHVGGGFAPAPRGAQDFSGEGFNPGNNDWALRPVASKPSCGSRPGWRSWLEGSPCWKPSSGQSQSPARAAAPPARRPPGCPVPGVAVGTPSTALSPRPATTPPGRDRATPATPVTLVTPRVTPVTHGVILVTPVTPATPRVTAATPATPVSPVTPVTLDIPVTLVTPLCHPGEQDRATLVPPLGATGGTAPANLPCFAPSLLPPEGQGCPQRHLCPPPAMGQLQGMGSVQFHPVPALGRGLGGLVGTPRAGTSLCRVLCCFGTCQGIKMSPNPRPVGWLGVSGTS
ncbi:EMI domain-containing protein 1 isoform X1 [Zonotrichia albicollis]|uniref:EMI domain-containing protein 1 isoform X1 n=1 Tax=Zonotrichia albicollis TaxID=44394 RepID=UPI003D80CA4C